MNMNYKRALQQDMDSWLDEREVLIIYGARQVGKTTFIKDYLQDKTDSIVYNCELRNISEALESYDITRISSLIAGKKIVAFDEAQGVHNIGKSLKIIYDEFPDVKVIATGSSSFDLSAKVTESLTGRNIKFMMFPLSLEELRMNQSVFYSEHLENDFLLYGSYPAILRSKGQRKVDRLLNLSTDYLFKDALSFLGLKNSNVLRNLLKALALQIGSQVSTNELSNLLQINRQKILEFLDVLEKNFIIFKLPSYSTNLRNEIKKSIKYYFFDNGIRNAILNNFTPLNARTDIGMLWENYCVSERFKWNITHRNNVDMYFWRSYDGAEIDLLEIKDGKIDAFEFKWRLKRKTRIPKSFDEKYKPKSFKIISKDNYYELIQ